MSDTALYLIALVPGEPLRSRVRELKEELRDKYGAGHALKIPAHITLQMPFRPGVGAEEQILSVLDAFAAIQEPFTLQLSGFDAFPPRVIFVKILNHKPVYRLHRKLLPLIRKELDIPGRELTKKLHPHMTIATRDLTPEAFQRAWPEYAKRTFDGTFEVKALALLKHNGKRWQVLQSFPFGRNAS